MWDLSQRLPLEICVPVNADCASISLSNSDKFKFRRVCYRQFWMTKTTAHKKLSGVVI